MSSETFNTADELRRIIAEGRISNIAVQSITGISDEALNEFLSTTPAGTPGLSTWPSLLSPDQGARLSILVAQLTEGFTVGDDDRLRGILESLTLQLHLTLQNISLLTRIEPDKIRKCLTAPETVPAGAKYELAIRASYLLNAIGNAAPTDG